MRVRLLGFPCPLPPPLSLSLIQASDFSSPAELGKHLKMLAADEEAYEAYFKWREDPEEEKRFEQVQGNRDGPIYSSTVP